MQEFSFAFNTQPDSPGAPRDMYHLAQAFYLAGNRAALNIEVGPNATQSLVSPSVVNYCFAVELFFKALIKHDTGQRVTGHELKKLFLQLTLDRQEEVRVRFGAIIRDPSFDVFIEAISDYFNRVRYEFENTVKLYYDGPIAIFAKIVYELSSEVFGQVVSLPPVTA